MPSGTRYSAGYLEKAGAFKNREAASVGGLFHLITSGESVGTPLIDPGIDGEAHQKLEDGTQVGVVYGDAQYRIGLLEFYQDYHNQVRHSTWDFVVVRSMKRQKNNTRRSIYT